MNQTSRNLHTQYMFLSSLPSFDAALVVSLETCLSDGRVSSEATEKD